MKRLLLTLLLISPFSFADWGDVYYCQMTSFVTVNLDGEATNWKLERFKLTLDNDRQAMVFGKSGFFSGAEWTITRHPAVGDVWTFSTRGTVGNFNGSKLLVAQVVPEDMTNISADCDKF